MTLVCRGRRSLVRVIRVRARVWGCNWWRSAVMLVVLRWVLGRVCIRW